MKKTFIVLACIVLSTPLFAAQARNIELVDVPTANTLIKGEIRYDIKFFPGGGILNRLYVGFFDRLMIGGALNVNNLIGTGNVNVVLPPKFLGKIRITDETDVVPAISIGYEGESYHDVPTKGAFVAVTKEIALGPVFLQATGTVYTNQFVYIGRDIDVGAGVAVAVTREFVISAEYDSIILDERGHLNFGVGYFFDPIQIDVGIKYGMGEQEARLSRILRIIYVSYF